MLCWLFQFQFQGAGPVREPPTRRLEGVLMAVWRRLQSVVGAALTMGIVSGLLSAPVVAAEPWAPTLVEQQYLTEVDQYLTRPRPPDPFVLQLGYQACQVRRSGGSSGDAKVAVSKTWDGSGLSSPAGAVVGSLVHVAVDKLCPEVGYP